MKLKFDVPSKAQPDPFIFEDNGTFYLYVTALNGVEAYYADDLFGEWKYHGIVCTVDGCKNYWAPCVIRHNGRYYMYFSCQNDRFFQWLHAAEADSPLGPFTNPTLLYDRFTIDAHAVKTDEGLFLFYAEENWEPERFGVRIFVDRLIDPYTPANLRREIIIPSFDKEISHPNRYGDGRDWHTLEGPFWFQEGGWQYVMYSGANFENDSYHIGYAAARSDAADLTAVDFQKHTDGGKFAPTLIKNETEEGTGHHSVIKYKGEYYAIYHGRDIAAGKNRPKNNRRTARVCRLTVRDGIITAERI